MDDSKTSNGATRIIPKSHKKFLPRKYINPKSNPKEEIVIEAKAGSILILNSNTWQEEEKTLQVREEEYLILIIEERIKAAFKFENVCF